MGGPGKSLGRNYHYSVEKDINFIAGKTSNTNVGFVGLLRRHDKPWMDRKVRSMNARLEWTLMGRGASHIGVIDTNCIVREEYMTHGLHLNSRGKRKLKFLLPGVWVVIMCRVLAVFVLSPMQEPLLF
jgi:hypothetical protein